MTPHTNEMFTLGASPFFFASVIAKKAVKINTMNWKNYFIDIYLII